MALPRARALLVWLLCLYLPPSFADDAVPNAVADIPEHSGVLLLSDATFASAIAVFHPMLVLFDSPVREGSLDVFTQFGDAAVALRATQRTISPLLWFATIDVTQQPPSSIPNMYSITGLPTILRFRCTTPTQQQQLASLIDGDGANATEDRITTSAAACSMRDVVDAYTGGKTSMELRRFVLEHPEKPVLIVRDHVALERVVTKNPFVVLVVVDGTNTQPYFDAISLAQVDTEASSTYCVSANRLLLSALDAVARIPPALFVFRDFDTTRAPYTGVWKKTAIVPFLQANKYSVLPTYASAHGGYFYDKTVTAHVLLFTSNSCASSSYNVLLRAQMAQFAVPYTASISGTIPGVILRFIEVPAYETALRDALLVTRDRDLPMLLIVDDVQAPPSRVPLFGAALIKALQTSEFVDTVGALLAQRYPPVFKTMEIVDEDKDGVDDATQPGAFESVTSITATATTTRELREVTVESQSNGQIVSPWEIYKQQQARVENVTSVDWILRQQ
ncbi:hypothetical protein FI667_g15175, partial [Globisporangium splendens]